MRLAQRATLATRPSKSRAGLAELTERWRDRVDSYVQQASQVTWVASLAGRNDLPLLRSDGLGEAILADVAERHATFSRMNLLAEAHRALHGARFASPADRVEVAKQVTRMALARSLVISPPLCTMSRPATGAPTGPHACAQGAAPFTRHRLWSPQKPGSWMPVAPSTAPSSVSPRSLASARQSSRGGATRSAPTKP